MPKRKIMIVEDEVITAMALRIGLTNLGFEVCELVQSGKEALENVARDKPDIVLMDINLHGEVDGIETALEIKRLYGIPVAFLTGYPNPEMMERAESAAPIGYFVKPVECEEMKRIFDRVLGDR
jgi:CheY-like chemotaxis protein